MARRRLPAFLRIGPLRTPIYLVDGLVHDNGDEDDEHRHAAAYGVWNPKEPAIYLDAGNGRERMKNTLVHEALHSMLSTANIVMEHDDEEAMVSRLAPVFLGFLRSNVGAIAYLQEDQ